MNGWTKYFSDGTEEHGSDTDVNLGRASWSKGRLDSMVSVSLSHAGRHIALSGIVPGEFWQADLFEAVLFTSGSTLIARRLARRIGPNDRLMQIYSTDHSVMLRVLDIPGSAGSVLPGDTLEVIHSEDIGNWLILENNPGLPDPVNWYFSRSRDG